MADMDEPKPPPLSLHHPEPVRPKEFIRDQIAAVGILRDEKGDEQTTRRMDACHLAMRYLDTFQAGERHSSGKVIATARVFERYLLEP